MLKYELHCHGVAFEFVYIFSPLDTSHYLWDDSFLGLVCAWQNRVQEVADAEALVKGCSGGTRELVPSVMLAGTAQVHAPVKSDWLSHRCANPTVFIYSRIIYLAASIWNFKNVAIFYFIIIEMVSTPGAVVWVAIESGSGTRKLLLAKCCEQGYSPQWKGTGLFLWYQHKYLFFSIWESRGLLLSC